MQKTKKKTKVKRGFDFLALFGFIFISIYILSLFIPILWALMSSLKTEDDFLYDVFGLPKQWMFSNYKVVLFTMKTTVQVGRQTVDVYAWQMFIYGFIYTAGCTVTAVLVPALTAYGAARYRSFMGRTLHKLVIVCMILPIIGSLPSEMQVVKTLGFYNNMFGMFIMKGNFLGMRFLVFYAAFKGISRDYSDAANIDGAGHFTIMFKIMFPLIMPTLATMGLLAAIGFWNDYSTPMLYMPDIPTIALGLFRFQYNSTQETAMPHMKLAGCILVVIPIMIIFLIFRNKLIMNVNVGGLKG